MLIAKLLPSQSIFMHFEYKNVHTYFLAFAATAFLKLFEIRKEKQNISILESFDWLTKITHVVGGSVYLKRPKQLFDISIFVLSL